MNPTRRGLLGAAAGVLAGAAAAAPTPNPTSFRLPADRDELLERYSAWLDAERMALMREMYPDLDSCEASRSVPASVFCRSTILDLGPPPSSRMEAVLEAAGVWTGPDTMEARRVALDGPQAETAAHPDADLLAAAAEFDGWMQRYLSTDFELAGNETPRAQAELARQEEYLAASVPALDRICELRAVTREGMAARARSLALWDLELMKPDKVYEADRLMQAIVRDLIGATT